MKIADVALVLPKWMRERKFFIKALNLSLW